MSVRNIIHKILDASKPLLRAGEGNGPGGGDFRLGRPGAWVPFSWRSSKRWVCSGCVYSILNGEARGAGAVLSTVQVYMQAPGWGGSGQEAPGSSLVVVQPVEFSLRACFVFLFLLLS